MPNAFSLGMIPLELMSYPVMFRYILSTDDGATTQELCFDAPAFINKDENLGKYAVDLWSKHISTLMSLGTVLQRTEIVKLAGGSPPGFAVMVPKFGHRLSTPARQGEVPIVIFDSGHCDQFSRRRFYLPTAPRNWQQGGVLTDDGFATLYDFWATWWMAFVPGDPPPSMRWFIPYPHAVTPTDLNPLGVAFRRPEFIRILSHTGSAPEGVHFPWP